MRTLRIAFSDFIFSRNEHDRLASFNPRDNVFTRLLAREYDVRVVPMAEAELLVYSTFGEAHRAFRGVRSSSPPKTSCPISTPATTGLPSATYPTTRATTACRNTCSTSTTHSNS